MYSRDELKTFITNTLIGKQNSIPYNRQTYRWYELRNITEYYDSILTTTNYLPTTTKFNERCYQIIHDLTSSPICKECDNLVNYIDYPNGYRMFCKPSCSTKGKKQIDTFIEKFGAEDGLIKYNEMIKNKTQTESRFIELYGEKEGKKRWKSRNTKCSRNTKLDGFISRYGNDIGVIKFKEYKNKLSEMQTEKKLIELYGEEEGKVKRAELVKKKSQTLVRFIEIYGEEDGLLKFSNYKETFSKNSNRNVSKESVDFFNPVLDYIIQIDTLGMLVQNTYIGKRNKQEYFLFDKELNKTYFYDLTIEPLKIIFEYNGSAFHPNKELLTEEQWNVWKTPFSNISADDKLQHDLRKLDIARQNGFTVIEIWDTDDKNDALDKCKMIISNKLSTTNEFR